MNNSFNRPATASNINNEPTEAEKILGTMPDFQADKGTIGGAENLREVNAGEFVDHQDNNAENGTIGGAENLREVNAGEFVDHQETNAENGTIQPDGSTVDNLGELK